MSQAPIRMATVLLFATLLLPSNGAAQENDDIMWQEGPAVGRIGNIALINVPTGFRFAGREGVRRFMELTENPPSGRELAVLIPPTGPDDAMWFVVFEFSPIGYVRDEEKDKLDATAILKSVRTGTDRANAERQKRGWGDVNIIGWELPPNYDAITNNLTWAIRASSGSGEVVNHSVRLLGRNGVMHVDLVLSPDQALTTTPAFDKLLAGFEFVPGGRYAEFRAGDKVAELGLTALIAGGVGAAAVKSGLLAKLWKLIVLAAVALVSAFKRGFAAVFRRKATPSQTEQV